MGYDLPTSVEHRLLNYFNTMCTCISCVIGWHRDNCRVRMLVGDDRVLCHQIICSHHNDIFRPCQWRLRSPAFRLFVQQLMEAGHYKKKIKVSIADPILGSGFPLQRVSNTENVSMPWRHYALLVTVGWYWAISPEQPSSQPPQLHSATLFGKTPEQENHITVTS